jgi:adenylate cyclase
MHAKKIIILAIGVAVLAALIFFAPVRFFDNLFYDLNFVFSGRAASDSVVVVAIDSHSIEEVGALPWPRTMYARLVGAVEACGPRALAMDFLFPRRDDAAGNDSLAAAFERTSNLVLPFRAEAITMEEQAQAPVVPRNIFDQRFLMLTNKSKLADDFFYSVVSFSEADTLFTRYARRGGFLNVSNSATSQKLREVIHVVRAGNEYYPSFALAAVAQYLGAKPDEFVLDGAPAVNVAGRRLPLTGYAATAYVNFRSKTKPVRMISAADLIAGKVDKSLLAGKLVFIGVTDPMAVADFFITPVRTQYPGVEVWANAALDILEGSWVVWGGGAWALLSWALVLLMFPGLALLIPGSNKIAAIASGAGLLVLSVVLSVVLVQVLSFVIDQRLAPPREKEPKALHIGLSPSSLSRL